MLFNALSITFKFSLVAIAIGAALSVFDITAAKVLTDMGLAPEKLPALLGKALQWAVPNLILGAMVIVPVWLVIYLLKPPKVGK